MVWRLVHNFGLELEKEYHHFSSLLPFPSLPLAHLVFGFAFFPAHCVSLWTYVSFCPTILFCFDSIIEKGAQTKQDFDFKIKSNQIIRFSSLMFLVAHRFERVEFWISNICCCFLQASTVEKNSKLEMSKSMRYQMLGKNIHEFQLLSLRNEASKTITYTSDLKKNPTNPKFICWKSDTTKLLSWTSGSRVEK